MRTHIGKFEIVRLLGQGAMGEVYLGRDPGIGREVAIKTIRPALTGEDVGGDLRDRFAREAKAAGLLQHPNVVTVFEFGTDGDLLYLVMEYVPGEDLATLLQRSELRPSDLLEILAQVCEGLAQAHKHGIIHRDIKPTNVMVQKEEGGLHAKVMDFGVAKLNDGELTQTGHVVGTVAYMAPEYLRTGKSQSASDLFSVGVILHEGLSGERPFAAPSSEAMIYTIIHDEPQPLEDTVFEGVSPSVKALTNRLLAKNPASRFATATDAARALRAARNPAWTAPLDDATVSLPGSSGGHARSTAGKPRSEWAIWAVGLGLAALIAGVGVNASRKQPRPAPPPVNTHIHDVVLEEAARQVDTKPEHALKLVQEVIDATPDNQPVDPDAYALKMAIYYRMGFMEMLEATEQEARDRHVSGAEMLKNAKFKAMIEKDKAHGRKLSSELRERLLKGGISSDGSSDG